MEDHSARQRVALSLPNETEREAGGAGGPVRPGKTVSRNARNLEQVSGHLGAESTPAG